MADQLATTHALTGPCRATVVQQLDPGGLKERVFACVLVGGMLLLTGCGISMSGELSPMSTAFSWGPCSGFSSQDIAGQCRSDPPTMGALETGADSASASANTSIRDTEPGASSRQLQVAWQPMGHATSGYMVYAGNSADTADVLVSDLSIVSGQIDPTSPTVTYDSARDLGLYPGDSVCFRIYGYDTVRALSDQPRLVCTVV